MYRNQLTDCKLQALPKYEGQIAMDLIDFNLQVGIELNEVHFCATRDKLGMEFLDQVAQNESYEVATKSIITKNGERIPVRSNLPKLASKWSEELLVKRERMDKVLSFNQTYNKKIQNQGQQKNPYSPQRSTQLQQM